MTAALPKNAVTMAEFAAQQVLSEGGGTAKAKKAKKVSPKKEAKPQPPKAPPVQPSTSQPAAQQAALAAAFATSTSRNPDASGLTAAQTAARQHDHIVWANHEITDSAPVIRAGMMTVGISSALFMLWAMLFPLSSAVITPGSFVAQGGNQRLQHAGGGTVAKLHVKEGDRVRAGQPILEMDPVRARAEHTKLQARHLSLTALSKRLKMEMTGTEAMGAFGGDAQITLRGADGRALDMGSTGSVAAPALVLRGGNGEPLVLSRPADPMPLPTNTVMDSQRDAYRAGRTMLAQEVEALERKADTLDKRREGVETRLATEERMLDHMRREYKRVKELASLGYVARNRAEERRTALMEQTGKVDGLRHDVAAVDAQIHEVDAQVAKVRAATRDEASREMTRIVAEMAEIADQLNHTRKTLADTVLRAPVSGRITNLATNTIGEVVGAGDMLAEIVPAGRALTVEARVNPADIAHLEEGQEAEIAVTAFNRRLDDTLRGRVIHVAPDTSTSPDGNDTWFNVRLAIEGQTGNGEARLSDVHAGMQAEVYINTGAQTFAGWMMKPVTDSFRRAFREK